MEGIGKENGADDATRCNIKSEASRNLARFTSLFVSNAFCLRVVAVACLGAWLDPLGLRGNLGGLCLELIKWTLLVKKLYGEGGGARSKQSELQLARKAP